MYISLNLSPANISQDIEPSSVWHTHHHTLNTKLSGSVNHLLHAGDKHLNSLKAKPLLSSPLLGQKGLKAN